MSDKTEKFLELLSPNSKNFMGSGLTFHEWFSLGLAEAYERSFGNATMDEKERRLDLIIELACEYKEIKKTTNFSTGFCKIVMEHVINGDFDRALRLAESLTFEAESGQLQKEYEPVFRRFRELVEASCKPGTGGKNN